jgi:two-component system, NtrC family, response regulator
VKGVWYVVGEGFMMATRYVLIMENADKMRNLLDRIVTLQDYQVIEMADEDTPLVPSLTAFDLASVEKMHIQRVLAFTHGNKAEAAKLLNIGLTTVYRKIAEYGLS